MAILVSNVLLAEEAKQPLSANVKVSPDWGKGQCASQPGKGIKLAWSGVTDARKSPSVGTLKKGDEETDIVLAGGVDPTVGEAIKTVFKNCGFDVVAKDAGGVSSSAEVTEFFAGAKKGFFTGETDAKGSVTLHFAGNGMSYEYNLGATKSDKRLRKKNIQQTEQVLTQLLEAIVIQIGESSSLFEELKKIAGK